jgi:sarcosine oxidase
MTAVNARDPRTSPLNCDSIVVGLGAMGSAAAYHLARRGSSVLGFDRFHPPHAHGSSHGATRIIREAYFEHPVYVPLVQRAYALWHELAQRSATALQQTTGGIMIGSPTSDVVVGALRSARQHLLAHELLSAGDIRRRFPALQPSDDMVGVLEPRAGVLFPEKCIAAHLTLACEAGAELHVDEPVLRWGTAGDDVRVTTGRGEYRARHLIVTAGAWTTALCPDLALPLSIERQAVYWFEPSKPSDVLKVGRCPVHIWQFDGRHFFYGFPDLGDGIKVARHHDGSDVAPDAVNREISSEEIDDIRALVRRFVPRADGALRSSIVCLYTNTPDEHFWIDRHPAHPQVLIVSACSGHGFKFSSVIGEIVADWALDAGSRFDLALFKARSHATRARS